MEWCEERYTVRFHEGDRRDFPPDDPAYKAAHMVTAWLDVGESGYADGVPLGLVMDQLGYKGDRSGLTDGSVVTDVVTDGEGVSFSVKDNFSDFDVCGSLADALGVDFIVSIKYRFSEGEGMERESGTIDENVRPRKMLRDEITDCIGETMRVFGSEGEAVSFGPAATVTRMMVDSLGPEPDRINLVRDGIHMDDGPDRRSIRVSDIQDRFALEHLLHLVNDNFAYQASLAWERNAPEIELTAEDALEIARHAKLADEGETDLSAEVQAELEAGASPYEALREWDVEVPEGYLEEKDVKYVREARGRMLEELYGSSAAYQNVSEYMMGFDLGYEYARKDYLSKEHVVDLLMAYCPVDAVSEGQDFGTMALEIRRGIRHGKSAAEAFGEFGVQFTPDMYEQRQERLDFRYDGDLMLSFEKAPRLGHDRWELAEEDPALVEMHRMKTGVDLRSRLGLDDGSLEAGFTSRTLMEEARRALLTPQNRREYQAAAARYTRKYRQQEAYERFNRPLAPRKNGLGKK